jgi:predicted Fe-Mo cluster-binding NifX family protein
MDIFTSIIVSVGIYLSFLHIPYIEGTVIILISFLILRFGIQNTWTSLLVLLDANLDPQLQQKIKEKINEIYGVKGTNEVKIRQSGPFKIVECKIQTSPTLPLYQAHQLTDKIENFITTEYKDIESIFIHIEPAIENIEYGIIPVKEINNLDSKVYGHFGRAPYYIILKINLQNKFVEIEDFFYNEFLDEKTHIGIKVIKHIIKYKLNILFTRQIGELSFYMLKNSFVDIYQVEENDTVKQVINKYFNKELKEITSPTHSLEESQSEKFKK